MAFFADPERAHGYAVQMRWPNGVACPRQGCGSASVQAIATRKTWRCKECKRQFSVRVGTIFEDSPIPFSKWLPAFWLLSNTKNGTSSCELGRALGVTQKTAWFMLHRIRETMTTRTFERQFSGVVEADETYIGGRVKNKKLSERRKLRGAHTDNKTAVFGVAERGGDVTAYTVPNAQQEMLLPIMRKLIHQDATLYTDSARTYWAMDEHFLVHQMVNHAVEYVRGAVHTNTIENFWSCLKRTLSGTYISTQPFHLDRYLDEQVFRFNAREDKDVDRFVASLKAAEGRRVTYAALTNTHPRWRLRSGRVAKAVARRRKLNETPISRRERPSLGFAAAPCG
ncbi:MAG: IS1595 family transposase [Candidatus Eremiobacteraeota bacterium]|nr:IS1595 family transposase [Candidatus Eremiobacteraeota bacterium]